VPARNALQSQVKAGLSDRCRQSAANLKPGREGTILVRQQGVPRRPGCGLVSRGSRVELVHGVLFSRHFVLLREKGQQLGGEVPLRRVSRIWPPGRDLVHGGLLAGAGAPGVGGRGGTGLVGSRSICVHRVHLR